MLFDDILASANVRAMFGKNHRKFLAHMLEADRFDLPETVAREADRLVRERADATIIRSGLVRPPPGRVSWWEVNNSFRPGFTLELGKYDPTCAVRAIRVGVLVFADPTTPGYFAMNLFYSTEEFGVVSSTLQLVLDCSEAGLFRKIFDDVGAFRPSAFLAEKVSHVLPLIREEVIKDWAGEISFWPAAMMLTTPANAAGQS